MENAEIDLHALKAIATKLIDIEETSKFLLKEIKDLKVFVHGKFKLSEDE